MQKRRRQGFTLMEILIVVAIIAVLIAVAIPTFNASLHKAREAADLANARAYFAYLQEDFLATGEYQPQFDAIYEENLYDTITYPDGTSVKLQTGFIFVNCPRLGERPDRHEAYQVIYICTKCNERTVFGA